MRNASHDGEPIQLSSNIIIMCAIFKVVVVSTAETELGVLFVNTKEAQIIRLFLAKFGHPQPPRPIHIGSTVSITRKR